MPNELAECSRSTDSYAFVVCAISKVFPDAKVFLLFCDVMVAEVGCRDRIGTKLFKGVVRDVLDFERDFEPVTFRFLGG